ncbi:MAG: hypothetical protein ACR2NM_11120 [Bythopirellula sp.]
MRKTIVATVAVALVMTTGLSGCKTAPKMPWSKTAATTDAETSKLAHSAPALPADVAKEAENLAASTPSIEMSTQAATTSPTTGGTAPPYSAAPAFSATPASVASNATVPSQARPTTPAAYPTTGASPYSTNPPAATSPYAATTPTPQSTLPGFDKAADLGAFTKPYNPNAVPPAKTVAKADAVSPPAASSDRYSMNTAANTPPITPAASVAPAKTAAVPAQSTGSDRYGNYQPKVPQPPASPVLPANVNVASTSPVVPSAKPSSPAYDAAVAPATTPAAASATADRYAVAGAVVPAPPSVTTTAPANTAGPVVASAPTYRPGGTSSYEGTATSAAAVEIASRPKPVEQPQVPNVSAPGSTSAPVEGSRYR